jgi:cytochrome P450
MVDQVAIFFLAGHETSASALAWALYLLALYPDWQDRVAAEAKASARVAPILPGWRGCGSPATCSARRCGSIRRCR